ncbi:MAG: PEP-CTERM sorting domain-containing protein [Phycisphaerae bacterium]|nr:PEP-CTERM sorting domain-containing protein [Phycisphaerae bacterium]
MKRRKQFLVLSLCVLAVAAVPAWAVVAPMDSASFATKFECDAWPSPDFPQSVGSPTVNGDGTITYVTSTSTLAEWAAPSLPASYTIEWRMQITSSGETYGAFPVSYYNAATPAGTILTSLGSDYLAYYDGSAFASLAMGDNTDAMHTFRLAYDDDNPGSLFVWRDGVSLGTIATANTDWGTDLYWMGGFGAASGGGVVDYFRWTEGAYSPVPEPMTLALLGLGALLARKRS